MSAVRTPQILPLERTDDEARLVVDEATMCSHYLVYSYSRIRPLELA
jgi:hypothetical protein